MNKVKITKKSQYTTILNILNNAEANGFALPAELDYPTLKDFVTHEIELLDNKAAAAAKRAAEKKEVGDQLRERVYNALSDSEFMTIGEIVTALNDPDISAQMVTSRLSHLNNLNRVEKDSMTVPATGEGGKARKVSAYRRING